ncbi:aldose epimerase family protein [Colwellia sp. RE-S-Sl-9]
MKKTTTHLNTLAITKSSFGLLSSGEEAHLFSLTNNKNTQICITNYGGAIVSINTPGNKGDLADIVLGYDSIEGYENDSDYLGAIVGRYAGRIKEGIVTLDEQIMTLSLNHENSQLHGGKQGLNKQLWQAEIETSPEQVSLTLKHTSPDGHNGFTGKVQFCVKYTLNNNNELTVEYFAHTNKTTIINLTQHSYFNLAGHDQGSILNHQVQLNADYFLPMNNQAYPTGEKLKVKNTPHDFTALTSLSSVIDVSNEQIKIAKGYDNYWLVNASDTIQTLDDYAAKIVEPMSGRKLTLYTDQPSVILYTGNYLNMGLDGSQQGKKGNVYQAQHGLCIEPQCAFDHSISNASYKPFSSCILKPEQPFYSKSIYVFDVIIPR